MKPRILIVEDEPDVLQLLVTLLTDLGCECIPVADACEAARLLRDEKFDLLLTDLQLRGGANGVTVTEIARDRAPGMPVVIVSGYIDTSDLVLLGRAGFIGILHKPFGRSHLKHMLAQLKLGP